MGVGDARGNCLTGMAQRVTASGGSVVIVAPEQWLAENLAVGWARASVSMDDTLGALKTHVASRFKC